MIVPCGFCNNLVFNYLLILHFNQLIGEEEPPINESSNIPFKG